METTYLYEVHPRKPIVNLSGVRFIRSPKSLQLTKEDVIECLSKGSVYRRFANEGKSERVTIDTVDRLHNAKFMTEEEYKEFLAGKLSEGSGKVVDTTPAKVEEKVETATEEKKDEVVEETKEENSKVDESEVKVEEKADESATSSDEKEDEVEPVPEEEGTKEESTEENSNDKVEENKPNTNFVTNKNNHHKNKR